MPAVGDPACAGCGGLSGLWWAEAVGDHGAAGGGAVGFEVIIVIELLVRLSGWSGTVVTEDELKWPFPGLRVCAHTFGFGGATTTDGCGIPCADWDAEAEETEESG